MDYGDFLERYMRRHPGHKHADAPNTLRLLRAGRERPRRRAAEQRDEIAPPHSITSSARARTVAGRSRTERFRGFEIDHQLVLGQAERKVSLRLHGAARAAHAAAASRRMVSKAP
jgi:hypothetical protein